MNQYQDDFQNGPPREQESAPVPQWKRSEAIEQLAIALAKAQGQIVGAVKDSTNPHFKSAYADLASVWEACRAPLSSNGLSVVQIPEVFGEEVVVTTMLLHASGQFITSSLSARPARHDPQGIGSVITYLRRYSLSAMAGIAPEDDDGNAASRPCNGQQSGPPRSDYQAPPKAEKISLADALKKIREAKTEIEIAKLANDLSPAFTGQKTEREKIAAAIKERREFVNKVDTALGNPPEKPIAEERVPGAEG